MDLSPRTITLDPAGKPAPPARRKRPWAAVAVLVLVLVGGGVAVTKFLTSAIDYYCNVDEIGVKSGCETGEQLRIQGTVDEGSVTRDGDVTTFTISFNAATMPVRYIGDLDSNGIFQECIPVVIHGKVAETTAADGSVSDMTFMGNNIEVKHSNEYEAKHEDRVDPATGVKESAACSQAPA